MTLNELKQIHKNNVKLGQLTQRYAELKGDYGINGKEVDGMPFVGRVYDTSMSKREEACDIETEYRELYYENELLIRKARQYIEQFPDWQLRMILTLCYINAMPTYDVAAAVGITEQMCQKILFAHFNNVF